MGGRSGLRRRNRSAGRATGGILWWRSCGKSGRRRGRSKSEPVLGTMQPWTSTPWPWMLSEVPLFVRNRLAKVWEPICSVDALHGASLAMRAGLDTPEAVATT